MNASRPPITYRYLIPELMDDPDLPEKEHHQALAGLNRINKISRAVQTTLKPITKFCTRTQQNNLTMLDMACGSAHVSIDVVRNARRSGLNLDLTVTDISETALESAKAYADSVNVKIKAVPLNLLTDEPSFIQADIVHNSLFLHHLNEAQTRQALTLFKHSTQQILVINDLRRCSFGLMSAQVGTRVLSRSHVVHFDGPQSVRAAYTADELRSQLESSGIHGATVQRTWPFRIQIVWSPSATEQGEPQ